MHIGCEETLITTADVSESAATFANITGLTFEMVANKTYIIEAWLIFQSAGTACGIAIGCNGPASPTAVAVLATMPIALDLYASDATRASRAYDSMIPSVSVDTANANLLCKLDALVRNGTTAGTFVLRFKCEVSGTAVTIKAGSVMRYKQVD